VHLGALVHHASVKAGSAGKGPPEPFGCERLCPKRVANPPLSSKCHTPKHFLHRKCGPPSSGDTAPSAILALPVSTCAEAAKTSGAIRSVASAVAPHTQKHPGATAEPPVVRCMRESPTPSRRVEHSRKPKSPRPPLPLDQGQGLRTLISCWGSAH
jgi:hypothetical protein